MVLLCHKTRQDLSINMHRNREALFWAQLQWGGIMDGLAPWCQKAGTEIHAQDGVSILRNAVNRGGSVYSILFAKKAEIFGG